MGLLFYHLDDEDEAARDPSADREIVWYETLVGTGPLVSARNCL
jgi:hypothetical protein